MAFTIKYPYMQTNNFYHQINPFRNHNYMSRQPVHLVRLNTNFGGGEQQNTIKNINDGFLMLNGTNCGAHVNGNQHLINHGPEEISNLINGPIDGFNIDEYLINGTIDGDTYQDFNVDEYLNNDDNTMISVDDYNYQETNMFNQSITITGIPEEMNMANDGDQCSMKLPIGYRFVPNDSELIYYLRKKVNNEALPSNRIRTIDLYQFSPQDLAGILEKNQENEWYVFTRLKARNKGTTYANRTTPNGYWKATSGDSNIKSGCEEVGVRKTLVYYEGKSSKTDWIMHEYKLKDHSKVADNFVLCRIHS